MQCGSGGTPCDTPRQVTRTRWPGTPAPLSVSERCLLFRRRGAVRVLTRPQHPQLRCRGPGTPRKGRPPDGSRTPRLLGRKFQGEPPLLTGRVRGTPFPRHPRRGEGLPPGPGSSHRPSPVASEGGSGARPKAGRGRVSPRTDRASSRRHQGSARPSRARAAVPWRCPAEEGTGKRGPESGRSRQAGCRPARCVGACARLKQARAAAAPSKARSPGFRLMDGGVGTGSR